MLIDTNILLYAVDSSSERHAKARRFLEKCRRSPLPWYLTWSVVYEFLRVATHPRVFQKPLSAAQAWEFINELTASPSLIIITPGNVHTRILAQTLSELPQLRGNVMHDTHIAVTMREHGVSAICTQDSDFSRFEFLNRHPLS